MNPDQAEELIFRKKAGVKNHVSNKNRNKTNNKRTMTLFNILWAVNAIAGLIVLYFFFIGLGDGSVSNTNMVLWLFILAVLAAIMFGSIWLKSNHHPDLAIAVLLILAIPALLYLIFILIMIFGNVKWN